MRRRVVQHKNESPQPDPYLQVIPEYIWVGADFYVTSNTCWIIE